MRCCFRVRRIATLVIGGVNSGYWYIGRHPYIHRRVQRKTLRGARPASVPESVLDARKTHERNVSSFVHWPSLWTRVLLGTGEGQHSCQPNNDEVRGPADDSAARFQLSVVLLEIGSESMPTLPMTAAGHAALNDELADRVRIKRPHLAERIQQAIADEPDLVENSEYQTALTDQALNEARIAELETKLARAEIIDVSKLSGETIKFGATVTLTDQDTGEERICQTVGEPEANPTRGKISVSSPIARALIGRSKGSVVAVETPGGDKSYKVEQVRWLP